MIDFTLSPSQLAIRQKAITFSAEVLTTASSTYSKYPTQVERYRALRPCYAQAVKAGLLRALIPKAFGGDAGTVVEAALLVEEMYKKDRSLSLTIFSNSLGLAPLLYRSGKEGEELREELLGPFLELEGNDEPLASLLLSEPEGTANWLEKGGNGLRTTAKRDGEDWILNGEKIWATNCSGWDDRGADIQCVVCRFSQDGTNQTSEANPADTAMILLVTRQNVASNAPDAYKVLKHVESAGHSATSGPHVKFTNFRVTGHMLIAAPGEAAAVVARAFTAGGALVGAMSTGIMVATFEAALAFAKTDSRGGAQSLLTRPSVSDMLMDIKMRTDAARCLTWKAASALDNGKGGELALEAKLFCSDLAVRVVVDAMIVVGVTAYNKESFFPELLNDAMCLPLTGGGNMGVRRRQLEKLMMADDYKPWASTYD